MDLDVPDDYQIPSTNPEVFWEDLKGKVGEQIEVDLFELKDAIRNEFPLFDFNLDQIVLEQIQRVYLPENGKKDKEIELDHVLFDS